MLCPIVSGRPRAVREGGGMWVLELKSRSSRLIPPLAFAFVRVLTSPRSLKMARSLFSVPIFFIVFRETLEAAIIVSVLLGLVEQIARPLTPEEDHGESGGQDSPVKEDSSADNAQLPELSASQQERSEVASKKLIRNLRIQVGFFTSP